MYQYFRLMHQVAATNPKEYTSIAELTKDVAISGGYRRENVTLKNGKTVIRTKYGQDIFDKNGKLIKNKPTWDDTLVAKWYCHFERYFKKILIPHPELKEFYSFILQRTFTILFNSLQLDKISRDSAVTQLFSMTLINRVGEALGNLGSDKRWDDYYNNVKMASNKNRVICKTAFNNSRVVSLEKLISASSDNERASKTLSDAIFSDPHSNSENSEILIDIRKRLNDSSIGNRLLEALLNSNDYKMPRIDKNTGELVSKRDNGKLNISKISKYMTFSKEELLDSELTIKELTKSYNIIKNTLKSYLDEDVQDDYDWSKNPKFSLNSCEVDREICC